MALDRKVNRKQSKYKNILKNDFNLETDNKPSKFIMVCNAGLVNNCQKERILDLFSKFGYIENVIMPENKSYCFVEFCEQNGATNCYQEINGKCLLECVNGPLYLLFLNTLPLVDVSSNFKDLPPGLHLIKDFVTEAEEEKLASCVKFDSSENLGELKNRLVKHYGYEFLYGCNNIDRNKPLEQKIPNECGVVFERIKEKDLSDLIPWIPDQLTVNKYEPGQGIPPHIDTHSAFEDPILSLSLGSDVVMDFKKDSEAISVVLPRRSLLIMSGEARYAWSHGICPRKSDVIPHPQGGLTTQYRAVRTSFTFRRILFKPCSCPYPKYCDSQKQKYDISEEVASSLEKLYVHEVYNKISNHFSDTRHKPWPNVLNFINSFDKGSFIVDIGCGNGKYFGFNKNIFELGLDQCSNLIEICHSRGYEGVVSNCLALPLKDKVADGILCIAVIHHLSTESRRIQAIKEMVRVINIGGKVLIYAWAKDQSVDKDSSYLKQSRKNRKNKQEPSPNETQELEINSTSDGSNLKLPLHENRTSFQHQDLLVPWKLKIDKESESVPTFLRYYHVFENNELTELCKNIDNVEIDSSYYDQGNWCVILKKINN